MNYTLLKDSLLNRQFLWKLNNYKKEAEEQRKTSQINLLNKDNQLKEQKLKQQAFVKNGLIIGLILLLLLGVFIFRTLTLKRKAALEKQKLESEKKQAELQQKATELEMQALRAQMNPHFIFNCLSSINKFILKNDTDAASDYLTRFSRLIRFGLTNSQLSLIPLSDEIEMLRLYLDMERLRFSESFDYNISYENTIEPETIYIPPMLLQPFCENAIWHGLMHKQGQGRLEVMMSLKDGQLQCIIADNGIGREKAAELKTKSGAKQKSFGLKITTERLALFNNEKTVHSFYQTEDILDEMKNVAGTKVILNIKFKNNVYQPHKELHEQ
jgi:sensor histidine kinase YesM